MADIWVQYRERHPKLDRYLSEWAPDYIAFYGINEAAAFGRLEREGLTTLLSADAVVALCGKRGEPLPVEVIARLCDYKFAESAFVTGEHGGPFLSCLPGLVQAARELTPRYEPPAAKVPTRFPFQRALFDNHDNKRLDWYPTYTTHRPFRDFITSVVKEFENQLRVLAKHRGRLQYPTRLTDEILALCGARAKSAAEAGQAVEPGEITIDRERLLSLIRDSDAVRKRLLEGHMEYGPTEEPSFNPAIVVEPTPAEEPVPVGGLIPEGDPATDSGFLPGLSETQRGLLAFLLKNGGGTGAEISAAFPGVFAGLEMDRINDAALEALGDLLIGFEGDYWYIMEEYIDTLGITP
jgi:hypothetical protein